MSFSYQQIQGVNISKELREVRQVDEQCHNCNDLYDARSIPGCYACWPDVIAALSMKLQKYEDVVLECRRLRRGISGAISKLEGLKDGDEL